MSGGTSASKTIGILLNLINLAQSDKTPTLTSVVAESLPHLRRGAMRDFQAILKAHNYWDGERWKESIQTYTFETGSQIEFFGADQSDKLRGGRRDRLFINEANNVSLSAYDELEVRTKEFVFLDWNPTYEFWFYTDVLLSRENEIDFITLTYKDNEALDEQTVRSIESRQGNKRWWTVYGLGQLGEIESRIYSDWQIIDEIPHEARLERRGLDFGYTNDPTAVVDIYYYNGGYILDERLYQRGLTNRNIADHLRSIENPNTLVIADSAEPKSIDEIKSYGVNIIGAVKGADSKRQGINFVQSLRISVTKRSINLIKEYRNYCFVTDRDGKILNEPEDGEDHLMDATRYALQNYDGSKKKSRKKIIGYTGGDPVTGFGRRPIFDEIL